MWFVMNSTGDVLAAFETDTEAYEASYTEEFSDAYEVAFVNDPEDINV